MCVQHFLRMFREYRMAHSVAVTETTGDSAMSNASRCWVLFRVFLAVILLTAAGLKAYQLATTPSLGTGFLNARWLNILVVEFELFFGIWLIFGMFPQLTWLASVVLFIVFASVSFYKVAIGADSCGCFGAVAVNPWYTFAFDVSVVITLLGCRPRACSRNSA